MNKDLKKYIEHTSDLKAFVDNCRRELTYVGFTRRDSTIHKLLDEIVNPSSDSLTRSRAILSVNKIMPQILKKFGA